MNQHAVYRFVDFVVDPETWRLSRGGQEIHLEPVVLNLLFYLISHRDRLVTRRELMDTVWGDTVISESAVNQAVARLRKALGDDSATHRYLLSNLTGEPEQDYYVDGLHFEGTELIQTYTPFPVPYEFLPPELGLFDVPEGYLTGTITAEIRMVAPGRIQPLAW